MFGPEFHLIYRINYNEHSQEWKQNIKITLLTKMKKKTTKFLVIGFRKKSMSIHIGSQKYTSRVKCFVLQ